MRPVPPTPSRSRRRARGRFVVARLDLAEAAGILTANAAGARVRPLSAEDAAVFCALAEESINAMQPLDLLSRTPRAFPRGRCGTLVHPQLHPSARARRHAAGRRPETVNRFLRSLPPEHQLTLSPTSSSQWGELGADPRCSRS
jgi:hypothetical protein